MTADISDGRLFFSGTVQDLSRFGLCLADIPQQMNHRVRHISVVVAGGGSNFKILTRPCWTWQDGGAKTVGLEILKASWDWAKFVMEREPVHTPPQQEQWSPLFLPEEK